MPAPSEAFVLARRLHQSGNLDQAEQLYRQVLQADPSHGEIWMLLGNTQQRLGKGAEAVVSYQHGLKLQPGSADAYYNLGMAQAESGDRGGAVESYRQALRLNPTHGEAMTGLGTALAEQGNLEEAVALLRKAIQCRPEFAKAHHNLGVALVQMGRAADAVESLRQALRHQPVYPEACYNLGNILRDLGKRDEAIGSFRDAVRLKPDYADAYNNLGLTLTESRRPAEAVVVLQHAVRLRPGMAEAHNNLGLALNDLGRFGEAEAAYGEALRLKPGYAEAHNNLASCWKEQGRLEEALAGYDMAIALQPEHAPTRWNRSLALLQSGDYARGWAEYEWRWRRPQTPPRKFDRPRWDGSPLEGRTILLWMEQGLGDMIQFLRYAPLVKARGGNVVVECPGFLVRLFSTCPGIDRVVAEGDVLSAFDVQAPLMSLPHLFGTTIETVPAEIPYLHADAGRVERWRKELEAVGGFRVGVVWQGNPHNQWDRHRSFPLAALAPLAAMEGVRLVSLQKDHGLEQLRALKGRIPIAELPGGFDPPGEGFLDTAAVMRNLDLIVTTDTATAHLAGALGVPAWVALAQICDWRWLRGRDDSPWYPTVRLFRQTTLGDWGPVFERMAAAVREEMAKTARAGAIRVEVGPGELMDRITILQIKSERLTDLEKQAVVRAELAALLRTWEETVVASEDVERLEGELRRVNEALWRAEDEIRLCERRGEFGPAFIEWARSIYRNNNERAAIKRRINERLGSGRTEVKVYPGEG